MSYTVEQIQLQSLVESDLVPAWRVEFARSIAHQLRPSASELNWVSKVLADVLGGDANSPTSNTSNKLALDNVWKMFATAKNHLKYPKVNLKMGNAHLKINIAGETALRPGALTLVSAHQYIGCVATDGELILNRAGRPMKDELVAFLAEFNKDPAKMAGEHGKLLSKCCFCSLPLSTPQSLAVGYGDTCAAHYGLPWGVDKLTPAEILDLRTKPVARSAADLAANRERLADMKWDFDNSQENFG